MERASYVDLIRKNRRGTVLLLVAFFLLVAVVGWALSLYFGGGAPGIAVGTGLALVLTVIGYAAAPKLALSSTGAHPASIEEYARLHNLVETVALAAGIPKPGVYVVNDSAPNAFATGKSPEHAAVAVTTGLLEKMNRDELEGVIAHELAHIRNHDIRVMTVAVATAGSIALITDIFWRLLWFGGLAGGGRRRRDSEGGGTNPLAIVGFIVVLVLAPIAAAMLRAALSRQRESLADATAVELTRYPTGLRSALEKLLADSTVVRRTSHATSHLWIESPDDREIGNKGARFNTMFSTHPPLIERINLLRAIEGIGPYDGLSAAASATAAAGVGSQPTPAPVFMPPAAPPWNGAEPPAINSLRPSSPSSLAAASSPAGWYEDPERADGLRYWDGVRWTEYRS